MPDPGEVRAMFGRIARHYDLLNRTLSLGIDQRWRRRAVRTAERELGAPLTGRTVVDVCCGTGDLALAFEAAGARVVGLDFTPQMVVRAAEKARGATLFAQGDALRLPVRDGAADVTSVAFGLRNVGNRAQGLRELARATRPGGLVLVLEFSMPQGVLLGSAYRAYFTRVLPGIGRVVSRDADAYAYLPRTVLAWPQPRELEDELRASGLVDCGHALLSRGIACLHHGRVPERGIA
ncbi:MAG: ubiquinone/menaquinone biosynthesis methyltransferase [Planctomycetota bacterium]|nr:MAG: ubiquinone/menaquinone biosynthesis methyltransferase [Planctomycetota bacterium]